MPVPADDPFARALDALERLEALNPGPEAASIAAEVRAAFLEATNERVALWAVVDKATKFVDALDAYEEAFDKGGKKRTEKLAGAIEAAEDALVDALNHVYERLEADQPSGDKRARH